MDFINLALPSPAQKPRILMLTLLIAIVDIAVFLVLNQNLHSIASAHLSSFLIAASIGYTAHNVWPINSVNKPLLFMVLAAKTGCLLFIRGARPDASHVRAP